MALLADLMAAVMSKLTTYLTSTYLANDLSLFYQLSNSFDDVVGKSIMISMKRLIIQRSLTRYYMHAGKSYTMLILVKKEASMMYLIVLSV